MNKWIKTSEKPAPNYEEVLILCDDKKNIYLASYDPTTDHFVDCDGYNMNTPTHWYPIPPIPGKD